MSLGTRAKGCLMGTQKALNRGSRTFRTSLQLPPSYWPAVCPGAGSVLWKVSSGQLSFCWALTLTSNHSSWQREAPLGPTATVSNILPFLHAGLMTLPSSPHYAARPWPRPCAPAISQSLAFCQGWRGYSLHNVWIAGISPFPGMQSFSLPFCRDPWFFFK